MTTPQALPASSYLVVDPKFCGMCGRRFYSVQRPLHKFTDGTVVDINDCCPKCSNEVVSGKKHSVDAIRYDENGKVSEREHVDYTEVSDVDRYRRECLRKVAIYSADLAHKVAERSRARHKGKNPCEAYKCRIGINPSAFIQGSDEYKEALMRQRTHWHLGGDSRRKI
jgi:hypothetical protein